MVIEIVHILPLNMVDLSIVFGMLVYQRVHMFLPLSKYLVFLSHPDVSRSCHRFLRRLRLETRHKANASDDSDSENTNLGKTGWNKRYKTDHAFLNCMDLYGSIMKIIHEEKNIMTCDIFIFRCLSLDLKSIPIIPVKGTSKRIIFCIWGLQRLPTPALPAAAPQSKAQNNRLLWGILFWHFLRDQDGSKHVFIHHRQGLSGDVWSVWQELTTRGDIWTRPHDRAIFSQGLPKPGHERPQSVVDWSWKSPCWDLVLAAWLSAASVASPSASCWTPRGWTLTVAWTGARWPTSPSLPASTSPALRKSCHGHRAWTSSWTRSSKKSKYVESI